MDEELRELLWTILRRQSAQHDQIEALFKHLTYINQRITSMSDSLTAEITSLQTAVAGLTSVEAQVVSYLQGVPALITAAVNAAIAAGTPADQLASLATLSSTITADSAAMTAALPATPATPTPPVALPAPTPPPAPAPAPTVSGAA